MNDTSRRIAGIHHVTAIAGPPQENLDFYLEVLGLRLVKKTVNFDDPTTYHFYYGDETGRPGSILTFFPWAHAAPGRPGAGVTTATAYYVPEHAMDAWKSRLEHAGARPERLVARFGEPVLSFRDPHGLVIELVGELEGREVGSGPGPLVGLQGVTLQVAESEGTARLLTDVFGYEAMGEEEEGRGVRFRFRSPSEERASVVDLVVDPEGAPAQMGAGSVHHVAFRAESEEDQLQWREAILEQGFQVTPVLDRQYFKSIYFREPAGVLFEIATDPPGFTLDESPAELGSELRLPPWLEPRREWIESRLALIEVGPRSSGIAGKAVDAAEYPEDGA